MDLHFYIDHQTIYGEELVLNMVNPSADSMAEPTRFRMHTHDGRRWECVLQWDETSCPELDYFYTVVRGNDVVKSGWTMKKHRLDLNAKQATGYRIFDHWMDIPGNAYLYSSAVTDCIAVHDHTTRNRASSFAQTVRLKVRAPRLRNGDKLIVPGGGKAFGNWNPDKAPRAFEHTHHEWVLDIDRKKIEGDTFEFKYALKSDDELQWELRNNRFVTLPEMNDGDVVVYELDEADFPIAPVRCGGTLVPVFSLRSEGSCGVGDFGDLKRMIEWAAGTGQRVLQVLPVNDTTLTHTWTDSYPYSCISIFALHPQYADLRQLPRLKNKEAEKAFEERRRQLNALAVIDYEGVNNLKDEYLRAIFRQEGKRMMGTAAFKKFFAQEQQWLVPYAKYCHLRDTYGTTDFSRWENHPQWDEQERAALSDPASANYAEVAYHYFVQYLLDAQMQDAHAHARKLGVVLKGDIPIGVSRQGCDVWQEPRYFNLNGQAGAPPDYFSVNGQNWGFPTYNWDEMLNDGCLWWIRRFSNMAKYFDAYRIDHVLGFFRIWEIPADAVHGITGHFAPALGMSREEIEGYGLHWQEELFTEPFIMDWVLDRIFREHATTVRENYLLPTHDGRYRMRPEFDTQRKVEAFFAGKNTETDIWIRDGLYALISDVLFVRDHKDANKFHPRISVQLDFIYESLYDSDKAIFNRLYNDYFYHRNNQFWYREAMRKLPVLTQATRMLVCAEDLGMVPDCVPWVMDQLKILSLELQAMPKDSRERFGNLDHFPYRSVCTISSHDMPTMRQWWDEDCQRTQTYFNVMLSQGGPAPHPLPGWLARDIVARNLACPSMLCIIAIQDWLAMDERLRRKDAEAERVNIPSNPKHYWRYRMHLSLEQLMKEEAFNEDVRRLLTENNRT